MLRYSQDSNLTLWRGRLGIVSLYPCTPITQFLFSWKPVLQKYLLKDSYYNWHLTTWVWTVWVHLYMDFSFFFFNSKYYSITWFQFGWTKDTDPWMQSNLRWRRNPTCGGLTKVVNKLWTAQMFGVSNPQVIQESTV